MASFGKDMLDKINSNKTKDGNEIIKEQARGSLNGAAIGLFLGLYFAHTRNLSYVVSGAVGAIIGGLVTRAFIKQKD